MKVFSLLLSRPNTSLQSLGREPLIDALRGYALFGVFLVRMVEHFSGWHVEDTSSDSSNQALYMAFSIFSSSKFRALFSFLFGMGFYYQLQKQMSKDSHIVDEFLKRLLVLMGSGLLHAYLVWWGDILHWYALAGLVLLLMHRLKTPLLLFVGLFLSAGIPILSELLYSLLSTYQPEATHPEHLPSNPTYWEMLKANFTTTNHYSFRSWSAIIFTASIGGYFLLGLWAGQVQLMGQLAKNKLLCTRIVLWSCLIGLFSGILVVAFPTLLEAEVLPRTGLVFLLQLGFAQLNVTALFIFHLCVIILLFGYSLPKQWLQKLIPAGKMTLTNYILQSVVGVWLFNGFGLGWWGTLSLPLVVVLTIGLFGIQIFFSSWWLRHFQAGPLETLWRHLTKMKLPFPSLQRYSVFSQEK